MPNREYDLVILIDCWHPRYSNNPPLCEEFYDRMVNQLSKMKFKNVVWATYAAEDSHNLDRAVHDDTYAPLRRSIRSENYGTDLKHHRCFNMQQVYRAFPEVLHKDPMNVLIGGQSFHHCVHWRSLGYIKWILQEQPVTTHPDIFWTESNSGGENNDVMLEYDTRLEWNKVPNCPHGTWTSNWLKWEPAREAAPWPDYRGGGR